MLHPHVFTGFIERQHMGGDLFYIVVFLPREIADRLPFGRWPRLRVEASVGGTPVEVTWMPAGDGRRYLMTPHERLDTDVGDPVEPSFALADQEAGSVPPALAEALGDLREAWEGQTAGRRRGLAHRVGQARTEAIRARRIDEVPTALADQARDSAQSQ